jgi:hypothetical protein
MKNLLIFWPCLDHFKIDYTNLKSITFIHPTMDSYDLFNKKSLLIILSRLWILIAPIVCKKRTIEIEVFIRIKNDARLKEKYKDKTFYVLSFVYEKDNVNFLNSNLFLKLLYQEINTKFKKVFYKTNFEEIIFKCIIK